MPMSSIALLPCCRVAELPYYRSLGSSGWGIISRSGSMRVRSGEESLTEVVVSPVVNVVVVVGVDGVLVLLCWDGMGDGEWE